MLPTYQIVHLEERVVDVQVRRLEPLDELLEAGPPVDDRPQDRRHLGRFLGDSSSDVLAFPGSNGDLLPLYNIVLLKTNPFGID